VSNGTTPNATLPLSEPREIALDANNHQLLVTEHNPPSIVTVDLPSGSRQLLSGSAPNALTNPVGIAVDSAVHRAIVANTETSAASAVFAVALVTGLQTVLSSNGIPDAFNPLMDPVVLAVDAANHRVFVMDRLREWLVSVDSTTGARAVVSGDPVQRGVNPFDLPTGIAYDELRNVIYVVNGNAAALLAVDVPTGQRVYLLR
jgi:DNA-binding beta-propeller fold protein YncE